MNRLRLATALTGVLVLSPAASATAATFTHYGPPNAAAWSLYGRSVAGGAGTLPNEYPSPQPWSLAAGDYCTAYKFAQPSAPKKSAPLLTVSDVDLFNVTGFDPGVPREQYQLRHNAQIDSSACQAKGSTWGFWANANTADNYCPYWCGVRHDYSTGMSLGTRPWANGYGAGAKLVMSVFRYVRTYSGNLGWAYNCAMLHDTTTSQRLEYCLRVWRSWSGPPYDAPLIYRNPQIPPSGTAFTSVVSDLVAAGTRYAQKWGTGADTVLGAQPSGNTYSGAITRTQLVNAVTDANAQIKSNNLNLCSGLLNGIKCYSTDPDKYALLGVEDGAEVLGSGTSHIGGYSSGLLVYTDY